MSDLVDLSKVPALFFHTEKEELLTEIFPLHYHIQCRLFLSHEFYKL